MRLEDLTSEEVSEITAGLLVTDYFEAALQQHAAWFLESDVMLDRVLRRSRGTCYCGWRYPIYFVRS